MNQETQTDWLQEEPKLSQTLNVLTILTFIGCGLSYISLLYTAFTSGKYDEQLAKAEEMRDKAGDGSFAAKAAEGSIEMLKRTHDNRYILLASGLIFTTVCLIGALQMRKLKKSGYPLYVIGELAPLVISAVILGFSLFGGITLAFSAIVAIVFVILYTSQRKHLVY